ncbi:helix-turn-helix domain-containing protein [Deinococcus sp.]|uniref:helix-turn-helix domain-containing protein n=1 Tax=Deinococcus sp. TaxID=47478 RepID=UPI003C7AB91C
MPETELSQAILTTEQVAARLGVKASRVRQLVGQGRLTPLATGLRAHLFSPEAVEAFEQADKPRRGRPHNH